MAKQGEGRTALVLGGGGVAGIAWETGLLAGLLERGIDVSDADVVVGTSAGSVVGTVLRSGALQSTYESLLEPPSYDLAGVEGLDLERCSPRVPRPRRARAPRSRRGPSSAGSPRGRTPPRPTTRPSRASSACFRRPSGPPAS
jgi:NTE family protein